MKPNQIGRFEIKNELGGNERGAVYEALDIESNHDVAVKLLSSRSLYTTTTQKKFSQQMALLKALKHPSLLPIIDFGKEDNRPFIVMPLMDGNLTGEISSHPMGIEEALAICGEIGDALDFAAANNQFHRDLKPNNILFDSHGHWFVADLGLVQIIDSLSAAKAPQVNPYYISPEQVRKRKLTAEAHVYSLATILFHMLTGETLFSGATNLVASFKHTSENPRSIQSLRKDVTEAFDTVLERALSKRPEQRFPSCREFIQKLTAASGGAISPEQVLADVYAQPEIESLPRQAPRLPRMQTISNQQKNELKGKLTSILAVSLIVFCLCAVMMGTIAIIMLLE